MNFGIQQNYEVTVVKRKKLILNDKVINYLMKVIKEYGYVYMINSRNYQTVTPDLLKQLLKKAEKNEMSWYEQCFAEVDESPEYEGVPFKVLHASPYNHRWEGDYDNDAYDDWHIQAVSLVDLLLGDRLRPYFAEHQREFDFEDVEKAVVYTKKQDRDDYHWSDTYNEDIK